MTVRRNPCSKTVKLQCETHRTSCAPLSICIFVHFTFFLSPMETQYNSVPFIENAISESAAVGCLPFLGTGLRRWRHVLVTRITPALPLTILNRFCMVLTTGFLTSCLSTTCIRCKERSATFRWDGGMFWRSAPKFRCEFVSLSSTRTKPLWSLGFNYMMPLSVITDRWLHTKGLRSVVWSGVGKITAILDSERYCIEYQTAWRLSLWTAAL